MAVHTTPAPAQTSGLTHSVAARIVEDLFGELGRDKRVSKSELIQRAEKHIATLPLYRKTEGRDLIDWGDEDVGDDPY